MTRSGVLTLISAGVLTLLVVVGVGVWSLFRIMAPMADGATHFVMTAGTVGPAAAYTEASPMLKSAMAEPPFEVKLRKLGLTRARSVSWWTRKQSGDAGVVAGTITLASGNKEPITIHLVRLGNKWMVSDFYYGTSLSFR